MSMLADQNTCFTGFANVWHKAVSLPVLVFEADVVYTRLSHVPELFHQIDA